MAFNVGDSFSCFSELESKLEEYKASHYVEFWCRTIESAAKRLNRVLKPELRYYEIKYCCVHGGQAFKSVGKGIRST